MGTTYPAFFVLEELGLGVKNIWNPRMEIREKRGQPTWAGRLVVQGDWDRMAAGDPDHQQ